MRKSNVKDKDRCSQSEGSMSSIIRELFAAQMHWVNVFMKSRRIIGTLAHFPLISAWGSPSTSVFLRMRCLGQQNLYWQLVSELATHWAFFFAPGSSSLKIPKVTQRLSWKVTKVEASKAPGFHPLCICPFPGQTWPELKHTDLASYGGRRQRHPASWGASTARVHCSRLCVSCRSPGRSVQVQCPHLSSGDRISSLSSSQAYCKN